jgi:hypothetical protein
MLSARRAERVFSRATLERTLGILAAASRGPGGRAVRVTPRLVGVGRVGRLPPPRVGAAPQGLVNELMGVPGLPAAWSAIAPGPGGHALLRGRPRPLGLDGCSIALTLGSERSIERTHGSDTARNPPDPERSTAAPRRLAEAEGD